MIKLATRMSRLGTESAFEVLARARALEAQGREIVHLEIGEPTLTLPAHRRGRSVRRCAMGLPTIRRRGIPQLRGDRRGDQPYAQPAHRSSPRWW